MKIVFHIIQLLLRIFHHRSLALGILLTLAAWQVPAEAAEAAKAFATPLPFDEGETLTFSLKWQGIPAGEVVLQVVPMAQLDGRPVRHFVMRTRTSPMIDPIYKLRERIDSYTDSDMTRSLLYKKKKRGKSEKEILVNFDWKNNAVQYESRGRKRSPVEIPEGSFDPLAVLYYYRSVEMREDSRLAVPVTDGKRWLMGKAAILGKETITLAGSVYDTYRIEPDVSQFGGIFKKSPNAKVQLWVTADHRRIPVRIKGRVSIGTIVCELVADEAP